MPFILIANFKSNKTASEVVSWFSEVIPTVASKSNLEVVVAPSFPHLPLAMSHKQVTICSQDVSPFPPGSYTGAVNANQLKDLGVRYSLIGHSERRRYFHETHQDIANKATELATAGITPILCLAKEDLTGQFAALEGDKTKFIFAYEPPADIGGTETASLEDIRSVVSEIRRLAPGSRVIYGGSVNEGNIKPLKSIVDGALVASASLHASQFISVINAVN